MDVPTPSVVLPAAAHFSSVAIFPAPTNTKSSFFLMKNTVDVPLDLGSLMVPYYPNSVYCLVPSSKENEGNVSVYKSKPKFLDEFIYCLEINPKCVEILNGKNDNIRSPEQDHKKFSDMSIPKKCCGCFDTHFPKPNTLLCKWNKERTRSQQSNWPFRLRGGAGSDKSKEIIVKAVRNAKDHGIGVSL